jgi:hypothetical protein
MADPNELPDVMRAIIHRPRAPQRIPQTLRVERPLSSSLAERVALQDAVRRGWVRAGVGLGVAALALGLGLTLAFGAFEATPAPARPPALRALPSPPADPGALAPRPTVVGKTTALRKTVARAATRPAEKDKGAGTAKGAGSNKNSVARLFDER